MICLFPDPYPDELLYSICARYGDLMQYPNKATAVYDFFGENNSSGVVDLPNKISHLVGVIPPGHLYTEDELIFNNTLYPFYAPFLPKDRADLVRDAMRENGVNHVLSRVGLTADGLPQPEWLRFCPSCAVEDKQSFRKTYWHRIHQIPGVEVCPHHSVFLENSFAPWRGRRRAGQIVSAENAVPDLPARHLDLTDPAHTRMLRIAQTSAWLLEWRGKAPGPELLRERYYNLLLRHGLAYYNGRVRTKELVSRFNEYYSYETLARLGCEIGKTYCNWLLRLLHTSRFGVAQNPIRHILLLVFLDCPAEELLSSFNEYKPFGDGPWPCLNRASDHFGQLRVINCRVTDNLVKGKTGRPLGTFECSCGFVYNRVGPDTSSKDRLRLSSVQSYGRVWETRLQELWDDTDIPLTDVARLLGVSKLTVTRHAIRLGLPMNTPGARQANGYERYKSYRRTGQDALEHYRKEWQAVCKANPNASRTQLMELANFSYLWLRKHDEEWIENHLPPVIRSDRRVKRINWNSEDYKLAAAIKASAERIKNLLGRPVRASITAIIRETGHGSWIERHLNHLPLTANAIRTHVESLETYSIRKVLWAEDSFRREGVCPTRHQLMARAVVRNKTGNTSQVQSVIDAAMERLFGG